jgi:hypothetical protein
LQTLTFSDDFSIKNQNLVELLINKSASLENKVLKFLVESTLLIALFPSIDKKEMMQAMITLNDEKTYLITFSNTQSFISWNSEARPLPISAKEIAKTVRTLGIDGFIIDINENHRFKVELSVCQALIETESIPTFLNEVFKSEVHKIVKNYSEIESIDIDDSDNCSARIIFRSKTDIADLVIEISKKMQENEQIKALAPQGLDLLVAKN